MITLHFHVVIITVKNEIIEFSIGKDRKDLRKTNRKNQIEFSRRLIRQVAPLETIGISFLLSAIYSCENMFGI